ncbi:MAG: DUF1345 domain-containing protein [Acidimicrobiia bacterium]
MRFRPASSLERLIVVGATWCVSSALLAIAARWPMALLGGWDIAAAVLVAWVWLSIGRLDASETHEVATREDNSRVASSLFLVSAAVSSLGGAGLVLDRARDVSGGSKALHLAVAATSVVLSWTVVQTVFALRYAHEYYTPPIGGIDFGDDEQPSYQDFAYVSFTVGMTFQVSDTAVQSTRIRRTVLRHALLAYLFGAVILAVTVNVIASILG